VLNSVKLIVANSTKNTLDEKVLQKMDLWVLGSVKLLVELSGKNIF
jgi:hypothetical protein